MKKTVLYFTLFLVVYIMVFVSCNDTDVNTPHGNDIIPQQVQSPYAINQNGRSIIKYKRPDDLNLKYVRAVYEVDGIIREVNSSYYTDSVVVDGFSQAGDYKIHLYSVNYTEKASEPVEIVVSPLTPPYQQIRETIKVRETFGGFKIEEINKTKAPVSIGIIRKYPKEAQYDTIQFSSKDMEWSEIMMFYTSAEKFSNSIRGQIPIETHFGIYIKDRWGHISDTLEVVLQPWEEIKCDKKLFKKYSLPEYPGGPTPGRGEIMHSWSGSNTKIEALWDEANITGDGGACFHTRTDAPMPQHFTIDLGKAYNASRFVFQHRGNSTFVKYLFAAGFPKKVTLWGTLQEPSSDGSFDGWTNLGTYNVVRPSGILVPYDSSNSSSALTEDDKRVASDGYEIEFPEDTQFRYFRFQTHSNWSGTNWVMLGEFTFYGAPIN